MEITNLENPVDDELMAELRYLTHQMEGLLGRVQADRILLDHDIEDSDLRRVDTFTEGSPDFLN